MYENQTFEVIMARMLNRVPNSLDKREGSIIYDALAPAAVELAENYIEIDSMLAETYAGTASRTYLIQRAAEQGITPFPATKAILKGVFKDGSAVLMDVAIGSRFNLDALNYIVTEKISLGNFKVQCETAGIVGNAKLGVMTPVEYIEGLGSSELTEVLIIGEDEETTEALRTRYFLEASNQSQDGNIAQYKEWAATFPGIGKAKIFPIWDGVNTVKVSILNAANTVAGATLIADFQAYLDPASEGLGNGIAPIGAVVTVSTATQVTVNIALEIELAAGYIAEAGVQDAVEAYFAELAYEKLTLSYLGLAGKILVVPCVDRIESLTMNLGTVDITLAAEEIPLLGTFSCQVVTS
jgi:uncharacterized phage protein gp47/JayE